MDPTSLLLQPLHGSAADGRSWSAFTETGPQTDQTTALRQSSLEPETRFLHQVVGDNSRRQEAWDRYLKSNGRSTLNLPPPPPGELCNPIKYFLSKSAVAHEPSLDDKERVKSHPVDPDNPDTCVLTLHVSNMLYRLERGTNHRFTAKYVVGRFDDEMSRGYKVAALLHSLQGQGHRWKPLRELHGSFMESLAAINRGEIALADYVIHLGHKTVDGEERYTSFGRTKYPDSTHTIYHVKVEFYDDKVSGLRSSE